jgi:lipoyl(octanoyl) transferase
MPRIVDLGRMPYREALEVQQRHVEEVLAARARGEAEIGRLLLVEHPPVITVTKRAGAMSHVLANETELRQRGVTLEETDRGGDVTYHGPGQIVCYPILDLNHLNLGLHAYMRLLEESVIGACREFGVECGRDAGATGVWTQGGDGRPASKIAAMGVRVRKWVSMHGLSLNVDPDFTHFALIVPCGLVGRSVTSLRREVEAQGEMPPPMARVREALALHLTGELLSQRGRAIEQRAASVPAPAS